MPIAPPIQSWPTARSHVAARVGLREYWTLAGLVSLGAGLRIWQYAANTSLFLDEILLARGILQTDLSDLTAPLPFHQVAAKGFLLLEKLSVLTLGSSDAVLRLVPFMSALVALVLFALLARRMLTGVGPIAAVLLFATAAPLISYGAAVKQYSVDICVAVLLWWIAWMVTSQTVTRSRLVGSSVAGAILVWFSQPAVLMVAAFGMLLLAWPPVWRAEKADLRGRVAVVGAWGVSALGVTWAGLSSMTTATHEYMLLYWAAGFPPTPVSRALKELWPSQRVLALFGRAAVSGDLAGLGYSLPALYAILAAAGFAILWRQNRRASVLLIAPLAVTLSAAVARQYPFSDRLILFLVPGLFIAIGASVEGLWQLVRPISSALAGAIVFGLVAPAVYPVVKLPPPYLNEHMKPVLAMVQAERRAGDAIYVYYGAAPAVAFYAPQYGLSRTEYSIGRCHNGNSRRYLQEVDKFRGSPRVWVLITHALRRYREREDILAYLDTIGTQKRSMTVASRAVDRTPLPAEGYLYDLSDAGKAATASAATFTLRGAMSVDPRMSCVDKPQSEATPTVDSR
jgi:hypothetical protein